MKVVHFPPDLKTAYRLLISAAQYAMKVVHFPPDLKTAYRLLVSAAFSSMFSLIVYVTFLKS